MGGWRAAAVLGTAVLVLGGCSSSPLQRDRPSDAMTAPRLGDCRMLAPDDVAEATNDTEPVPCSKKHTAETFLVGELPGSTGKAYTARTHGAHVYRTCTKAFARFLGGDESLAMRTRLSWAWFRASETAWDKGARWFRCDLIGGQADDKELRTLPRTAKALLSKQETSAWMQCAQGQVFAGSTKVYCSEPHDWRAVTAVKIGDPKESYPGDRISEVRARDNCSDWVGAWMNYPTDYEYAYTIFREAEWKAGNRRALCWAKTDK